MKMAELEQIGIAGPNFLRETLTNCSDPLKAIEEFQEQNSILLPSLKPSLHFLDLHSISRVDFHTSVVDVLRDALLKQISEINEEESEQDRLKRLNEMLDKSFPVIRNKKLQPIAMHIMKYLPNIKQEYLLEIEKDSDLYAAAPTEAKRQIWQRNQSVFGDEVSPILNTYIKQKQALLFDQKSRRSFFHQSPKVRRGDDLVKKLVDMIGQNIDLYDMMLQFLRTYYLKTRNVQYCTLRSDILMSLHENEVNEICSMDPSHKFTWCLDACVREHYVDSKRAKELQVFLDSIRRGQDEVLGDLAMVLADPYALHTCCATLMKLLHNSSMNEQLPRDNPDYILILRLINLGLNSWSMMNTGTFKETKVASSLVTNFLADMEGLMVEEQLRSLTSKIPDVTVESADGIPTSLHKSITDSEVVAYIMVYFASHGFAYPSFLALNSKEVLLFGSVLEALKEEGDIAYRDTLLHTIVNDITTHIDSVLTANYLVYIVDMFFVEKMSREGVVHHTLRLFSLIQKKIPPNLMVELLTRVNVDGQEEAVCQLYKSLQQTADNAENGSMTTELASDSPLSAVPMPT